jgi:molybdopterin adenylyltransferase
MHSNPPKSQVPGDVPSNIPEGTASHRTESQKVGVWRCAVLTVSDSRTLETDESGPKVRALFAAAGHEVRHHALLPNDESRVRAHVADWLALGGLDVIVVTGGTGLGSRDRTIEALRPLFEKELPGFGELFRLLSYQEQVGTAAILSRATAGTARGVLIFSLPGSRAAVELAMTRIILAEAGHALREVRR